MTSPVISVHKFPASWLAPTHPCRAKAMPHMEHIDSLVSGYLMAPVTLWHDEQQPKSDGTSRWGALFRLRAEYHAEMLV